MKKECAHTRKALAKYLQGHLFKLEQMRIERHLRSCVVCYSQYQTLKRADETRKYLKDITPPEGVVQIMKESISGLGKLKKVLYRPLWIVVAVLVVASVIYFLNKPRQIDIEIDNIIKTAPSRTVHSGYDTPRVPSHASTATSQGGARSLVTERTPESSAEPILITLTTDDDRMAMRRINEVMRSHGQLRKYKFTDTVREISDSLTSKELFTFFSRIESVVKISYNRKKLESLPSAQPIPFVMRLVYTPRAHEEQAGSSQTKKKAEIQEGISSLPPATVSTGTVAQ